MNKLSMDYPRMKYGPCFMIHDSFILGTRVHTRLFPFYYYLNVYLCILKINHYLITPSENIYPIKLFPSLWTRSWTRDTRRHSFFIGHVSGTPSLVDPLLSCHFVAMLFFHPYVLLQFFFRSRSIASQDVQCHL